SVWHVNGWTRSVTALVIATIVADNNFAASMRSSAPEVYMTFQTIHIVMDRPQDSLQAILASRALTMASANTRGAPNCFNHLHQLRNMLVCLATVFPLSHLTGPNVVE
ncbi:MAG: hypothetical protein ACKPKO_36675, partial [Candidatus Fonsibacter sp.]